MTSDQVLVPIGSAQIIEISGALTRGGSGDSISAFVERAIDYLIENLEWKSEDDLPILTPAKLGYRWKSLLLPDGARLRMRYAGSYHYAKVEGDQIILDGASVSPSEFTFKVSQTARNAWRDIEIQRPGESEWILADRLR